MAFQDAIEALQQHKIDACVLRRVGPEIDGVHQVVIARDRMMLVLPLNHPMAVAAKVALSDVIEEPVITFPDEKTTLYKQVMQLWTRTGSVPRIIQKAESGLTILGMVAGGFGNAILPSTLSQIQVPNVVWKPIDVDEQLTSSAIILLYRADAQNEKIQSRFVEYVRRFSSESN